MRKLISILLCVVLLTGFVLPAAAEENEADVVIRSAEDFLTFAENCRLDSFSKELTVSLEADIDLGGVEFEGIPIFCGTFLGNGHRIENVRICVKGSQRGLFRYLTQSAVVRELTVCGQIAPQGDRAEVGGIVGNNAGTLENCVFEGEVIGGDWVGGIAGINTVSGMIEGCTVMGTVSGKHFAGGIAGENAGVIRTCENKAKVNTTVQQNSIDISDISVGTITGTESSVTVTDIGGIAGSNAGVIRSCINRADVGYKHMGYNVGGIVGSHTGYVVACENYGAVSGRKEVGGIAGQMEPSILLEYETDTLQMLKAQMQILGDLTDRAAMNAQNNTAAIQSLMAQLEKYTADAEEALNHLVIDPDAPEMADPETYLAALQTLSSSLSGISRTMSQLYGEIKETGEDLSRDLQEILKQIDVIDGILNSAEDHLGGSVTDVSDQDTAEDLIGKLEQVTNHGPVMGDLNVGGITGAIALENDLDPEQDVTVSGETTLNATGKLRSVILSGVNQGNVSAKRRNAGGIVGWQSLGLVKLSENSGAVSGGSYTGGIAGQSLGYIRSCAVKAVITGTDRVGGVAGSGTVVTDSAAMVKLTGTECMGAILGIAEQNHTDVALPISGNVYTCVEADKGAIDGISYDTLAQPMTLEEFLAQENLQALFQTVQVIFAFEDGTVKIVHVVPGGALDPTQIPEVPEKAGYVGQWGGLDAANLESVLFDITFETRYISHSTVIQSGENRNGKPLLLVQGDFLLDAAVIMTKVDDLPQLSEGQSVVEGWQFAVDGCEHITAVRYLLPNGADAASLQVYLRADAGHWRQAAFTQEGSYLVIPTERGDDAVVLVQQPQAQIPWLPIAVLAAVAVVIIAVSVWAARRSKKRKQQETVAETASELN